jgi:outer membrane protein assembly factor BamE (lipoprotein component of BamABCDE complex)
MHAMNALLRFSALLLALVVLSGCGGMAGYKTVKESDFAKLAPGKSTKADVQNLLGRPASETGGGGREEVWEYPYYANTESMLLWLFFDPAGTLKTYRTVLPRLYLPDSRD